MFDYLPFVSVAAMNEKHFMRSPVDPTINIADKICYERLDVHPCDINHVTLSIGKKRYVVDGISLSTAINSMLARSRR